MERNHIIGFVLIFATLLLYTMMNKPSEVELEKRQNLRDSLEQVQQAVNVANEESSIEEIAVVSIPGDTTQTLEEKIITLENDVIQLDFNTKGGVISKAVIKNYTRSNEESNGGVVTLLNHEQNRFEYLIPVQGGTQISTRNMIFDATVNGKEITMHSTTANGVKVTQKYTLTDSYNLDYDLSITGQDEQKPVKLNFVDVLPKLEKSDLYEQRYSTIYFKRSDDNDADYCSCTSDDVEDLNQESIDWFSHSNQFFSTNLISRSGPFANPVLETKMTNIDVSPDLKILKSTMELPADKDNYAMTMYIGPNEYDNLAAFKNGMEQIIPFGSSIFGTINRYVVRPSFDFLSTFINNKGLVIILLIFIIKMLLYPLLYKMLYSQAKMGALKPELTAMKEKYKDDLQKQQMESMKIYQEFGVSPLSGCLPMLLQMPIWIALYRFFPASITFRQEPFLWAEDLSSYDAFFQLPFEIPFMGAHISLFTLLWAVSTVIYTYYSTKHVDMSANPAMKYVQYFMPLMFLGFFNSYASGLTCYMFFSNLINILQTIVTKNFIFDEKKIRAELEIKKAKPKKKGGFQSRIEEAMKQQRAIAEQKAKAKK